MFNIKQLINISNLKKIYHLFRKYIIKLLKILKTIIPKYKIKQMGSVKELMMERMEEEGDERLARKLGISYVELMKLNHSINTEESNDGLIYNYIITFSNDAPKEILAKVKGIDRNNTVWLLPWEIDGDDYFEEQYDAIISNKHFYETFRQAISFAEKLNQVELDIQLTTILKGQIYVSVISALEAFLSETFINLTNENEEYFRNFIETYPDFKNTKFEMSRIFAEQERIKETARKVMVEIIYHNLSKVAKMYASTFNIEFPKIAEISKCIIIRHDLVHRNGKTKNGETVLINSVSVTDLISKSSAFVDDIAKKLNLTYDDDLPF